MTRSRFLDATEWRAGVRAVRVRHAAPALDAAGEFVPTEASLEVRCSLDVANLVLNVLRAQATVEVVGEVVDLLGAGDRIITLEE